MAASPKIQMWNYRLGIDKQDLVKSQYLPSKGFKILSNKQQIFFSYAESGTAEGGKGLIEGINAGFGSKDNVSFRRFF